MGAKSSPTMYEFLEDSVSDWKIPFLLSSDIDNDISGCLVSAVKGQNKLESVCRQTLTHGFKTRCKSEPENAVQGGNPQ